MKVSKQLVVLAAAVGLFSLSELFPPWLYTDGYNSAQRSAGYHFRNSPPAERSAEEMRAIFSLRADEPPHGFSVGRDRARLYAQRIAIPFLAIGLLLITSTRRSRLKLFFGGASVLVGSAFAGLVVYLGWRLNIFL